jgi:hypothetical protein
MRTSGAGNESMMTVMILLIALGVSIILFGGPDEFAHVVNSLVRDAVEAGVDAVRSR